MSSNRKHAYLIMADGQLPLLEILLKLLDHKRNDIFLHLEGQSSKDKVLKFPELNYSELTLIPPQMLRRGDYSQIRCELDLFSAAFQGEYQYYHLISGADLPLCAQDEILAFFDANPGRELISFAAPVRIEVNQGRDLRMRFRELYLRARDSGEVEKQERRFPKGPKWVSVTHAFVKYILEQELWIQEEYRLKIYGDSLYKQALVLKGDFESQLYRPLSDRSGEAIKRFIPWIEGGPMHRTLSEFDQMMNCGAFWARMFNLEEDPEVINAVLTEIRKREREGAAARGLRYQKLYEDIEERLRLKPELKFGGGEPDLDADVNALCDYYYWNWLRDRDFLSDSAELWAPIFGEDLIYDLIQEVDYVFPEE